MKAGICLRGPLLCLLFSVLVLLAPSTSWAATYVVDPDNYRDVLKQLEPGDTLALEAGDYRDGLPIHELQGTRDDPIHIAGPEFGEPAVFHGRRGHNTVSIVDASWVVIRSIEIDNGGLPVDGVKLEGHAAYGHHITLADLTIHNFPDHQQIVGISTKAPARGWVIRGTEIRDAGTGMYFGRPDGTAPFVDGVIEHNLVSGSIGYALQIKHQTERPDVEGLPEGRSRTAIRHNVFAKDDRSSSGGMARPNVLLGHFPETGAGRDDQYVVHGNLFYNNPSERLFQGEGNIALYNNLFVNPVGNGIAIMPHNGHPRRIAVFHNTLLAAEGAGFWFETTEQTESRDVVGNAVFAAQPFSGDGAPDEGNVTAAYDEADDYLHAPFAAPGALNLMPVGDALDNTARLDVELLWDLPGADEDFDGEPRSGQRAGAYDSERAEPRWYPAVEPKPATSPTALGLHRGSQR